MTEYKQLGDVNTVPLKLTDTAILCAHTILKIRPTKTLLPGQPQVEIFCRMGERAFERWMRELGESDSSRILVKVPEPEKMPETSNPESIARITPILDESLDPDRAIFEAEYDS